MLERGFCFCATCESIYTYPDMTPGGSDETLMFWQCPPDGLCPNCLVELTEYAVSSYLRETIRRE
eukprot:6805046-Alexandrium_andersonii.AAC.1